MPVKLNHGKALAMLSLTSLIDVVFLLLIFFLVATKFAEEDAARELNVRLPSASMAKPITHRPETINVTIDANERISVAGKQMTLPELEAYLSTAKTNNPLGQNVKVRADRRATIQSGVNVINACNKAGIESYSLETDATVNNS